MNKQCWRCNQQYTEHKWSHLYPLYCLACATRHNLAWCKAHHEHVHMVDRSVKLLALTYLPPIKLESK
jgi:hypothetical protein